MCYKDDYMVVAMPDFDQFPLGSVDMVVEMPDFDKFPLGL
jgi:hypothetical protein